MTEVLLAKTAVSAWLIQPCLGCWSQPPRRCCYASIPLLHTLTWMTCLSGTTAMPTPSTCAGTSYISLLSPLPPISQQPVHLVNLIIRPAGVAQSVERVALNKELKPQGRGFEPRLRLFLHIRCLFFLPFVMGPEKQFLMLGTNLEFLVSAKIFIFQNLALGLFRGRVFFSFSPIFPFSCAFSRFTAVCLLHGFTKVRARA